MKQFVIGDIHGAYKALLQVFERSKFDYKKDELIVLGDVCDGWKQVKECFDELLKIEHLKYIIGNHDYWALTWYTQDIIDGGIPDIYWTSQGGQATIDSYGGIYQEMPIKHINMIKGGHVALEQTRLPLNNYEKKQIFVHGGIESTKPFNKQNLNYVMWDRELFRNARIAHGIKPHLKYGGYDDIFIGHTTTRCVNDDDLPLHYCNVWNLDTGAGWGGKLTIMNVDTKEYWQSDKVKELYPKEKGRG